MIRLSLVGQRLAALFLLGAVLLTFPVIGLVGPGDGLLGVPPLFIWVYGVWAALIALAVWLIERSRDGRRRLE